MKNTLGIFIFRRSFRLYDNIGLIECLKNNDVTIPIFIFTPEQVKNNRYKSDNAIQFMVESLTDLDQQLRKKKSRLFYFFGEQHKIIEKLVKKYPVNSVYVNVDYTPYSIKRDRRIYAVCKQNDVKFHVKEDILLNPVGSITTDGGTVYQKFTPYHNKAKRKPIPKPIANNKSNYMPKSKKLTGEYNKKNIPKLYNSNPYKASKGGRTEALKILKKIGNFKKYNDNRNRLTYKTTRLSGYIKFGCVSIREVYHKMKDALGGRNDLLKQLYWRDFYYNIAFKHPIIFSKKGNLKEKYDKITWSNDIKLFNRWKSGKTGFPIVDACMNELNTTGFMHNRGRLIVASFLVKTLLVDWKLGEKYFAQQLQDYDPAVNTGNWGWVSGSGADSQPYFRIFNPWSQGKKHDPKAEYIKLWIPELKKVPEKHIHEWNIYYKDYDIDYPKPIVNYKDMKKKVLKAYKKAL